MENDDKKKEFNEKIDKQIQENIDNELIRINEENAHKEKIAREILSVARNTILINLRFMDMAINQFEHIPVEEYPILTDGKNIFFNPEKIIKSYVNEKNIAVRNYLHIIFHCVFRHMIVASTFNPDYWDLACDIAVENLINELDINTFKCKRQAAQMSYIEKIKREVDKFTAEKIYFYLMENKVPAKELKIIRSLFYADNHEIWYEENPAAFIAPNLMNKDDLKKVEGSKEYLEELEQKWKDISERMQVDIDTFGRLQGKDFGNLSQSLDKVNREKYNYTEFLKKFSVLEEAVKINDDEFDYIFYTYGLNLYDNMPLVEPLEYKDVKHVKEFVIAIDTSGSTSGKLVQSFIQKTYNILKTTESFSTKVNIHIIQCDATIQEHVKITSQKEFDEYLETMELHGFGGTDFRPVFTFVQDLIDEKEFKNLKGMIYFTDGYGTFPSKRPPYSTAFVFVEDDYEIPEVPAWAIKLILPSKDIME